MLSLDLKSFPKDIIFANFQCLRCGLCCKNYEGADIIGDIYKKLESDGREDLKKYIWIVEAKDLVFGGTEVSFPGSCSLCRKVRGKPYYTCRIHKYIDLLPVCKAYLCSKSLPVSHLNYKDVDELIGLLGKKRYYDLIERDWDEEFDWSRAYVKTHNISSD